MSRIRHYQVRLTALVVIMAFAVGTLFGPAAATAVKGVDAFITNTPADPVPVSVVINPTVLIKSGSQSVAPNHGSAILLNNVDVSAYKTIRLMIRVSNAVCPKQNVNIQFNDFIANYFVFPDCGDQSFLFDTPGTTITVTWDNGDPTNTATASFQLVGRP